VSRYPLEPLRRLRNRRVDESQKELAARVAETAAAEQRRLGAKQAVEAAEQARCAVRATEENQAEVGQARVADWQQLTAFERSARATEAVLREREQQAQQALEHTQQVEARTLESLVAARAEARLSELHRARFQSAALQATLESEEEDAQELWASRTGQR
jgi:hypothetical protein